MINILIVDDNIYYAKTIMNVINDYINNVRVINIATDGKEAIDKLNNDDNIDIVLLDLKMPILNGIDIIHKLDENKRKKLKESIIVVSGEPDMIIKVRDEETIYNCIDKVCNMSYIIKKINELVEIKEREKRNNRIDNIIIKELKSMGYNFTHKGTIYLADAIKYIYNQKIEDELNLKRDVYPIISQKYNKPIYCIKGNIIKATNYMDKVCNLAKKKEYFSFYDNAKPTVKLVIYTILNKIKD